MGTLSSRSLDTVQIPSPERASERVRDFNKEVSREWRRRGGGKPRGRSRRRLEGLKGRGKEGRGGVSVTAQLTAGM